MSENTGDMELVLMSRKELDELHELRKFKENLPEFLQKYREETCIAYETARLKMLHSREKEDPIKHRERSKKLYERKKDEILAKRRAAKLLRDKDAKDVE